MEEPAAAVRDDVHLVLRMRRLRIHTARRVVAQLHGTMLDEQRGAAPLREGGLAGFFQRGVVLHGPGRRSRGYFAIAGAGAIHLPL